MMDIINNGQESEKQYSHMCDVDSTQNSQRGRGNSDTQNEVELCAPQGWKGAKDPVQVFSKKAVYLMMIHENFHQWRTTIHT